LATPALEKFDKDEDIDLSWFENIEKRAKDAYHSPL